MKFNYASLLLSTTVQLGFLLTIPHTLAIPAPTKGNGIEIMGMANIAAAAASSTNEGFVSPKSSIPIPNFEDVTPGRKAHDLPQRYVCQYKEDCSTDGIDLKKYKVDCFKHTSKTVTQPSYMCQKAEIKKRKWWNPFTWGNKNDENPFDLAGKKGKKNDKATKSMEEPAF